jgi:hypothetical protein
MKISKKTPKNFVEPKQLPPRSFITKTPDGRVLQTTVRTVTLADRKAMSPERAKEFRANMQRNIDSLLRMGTPEDDPILQSMRYMMDPDGPEMPWRAYKARSEAGRMKGPGPYSASFPRTEVASPNRRRE